MNQPLKKSCSVISDSDDPDDAHPGLAEESVGTQPGHHFDVVESFRFTVADNPGLIAHSKVLLTRKLRVRKNGWIDSKIVHSYVQDSRFPLDARGRQLAVERELGLLGLDGKVPGRWSNAVRAGISYFTGH